MTSKDVSDTADIKLEDKELDKTDHASVANGAVLGRDLTPEEDRRILRKADLQYALITDKPIFKTGTNVEQSSSYHGICLPLPVPRQNCTQLYRHPRPSRGSSPQGRRIRLVICNLLLWLPRRNIPHYRCTARSIAHCKGHRCYHVSITVLSTQR